MQAAFRIRSVARGDLARWEPLWAGYNAFYHRTLAPEITRTTWLRFFDAFEPVHALVAERGERLLGLVHFLYHRSTITIVPTCYLQDLFTAPDARGHGVGRALIQEVYEQARRDGLRRVYWQTQASNTAGRLLYDKVARHAGFIVYAQDLTD